ncbi:PEP/pyruvate-binding domain-containing protein [Pseudonocardia sp. WMMC193]|uniref:PEP/pyruvate-binding domain-containing protein n=1 Tax=Pseudonocardia sp. WMMC193 TaxID=2911965 RepID=UPI001F020EF4|nr:PEP/pyruvate-binding domain-containing protein [Pseudonocardia sp. WMMC193]MCF7553390.1 pyruvate, phosphate dikinase [Pseudonocardia sp. WMMC193]
MDAFVLPLASPEAVLATVGGKGASLARAARAGLPVPAGFHVTIAAHQAFRARPDGVAAAIRAAYAELGAPAVAVRSSATAEDLPGLSFAGQQDTYLNVRGADAVLEAVQRCWASLGNARAVAYRARAGVADAEIAVVVQVLVAAEAAGVLFTADPVTGATDRMLVDAAWGLGESVVGGAVTPDSVVADAATGAVRERRTGDKAVRTVVTEAGTEERPVPDELRRAAVLDDVRIAELVALGRRVAELYGDPTDLEWALADGAFALLQARPITSVLDPWNDSRGRDHLWTNTNLGEALPGTPTPLTWSFIRIFSAHAMTTSALPGFEAYGRIGGRPYMDLSQSAAIAGAVGVPRAVFRRLVGSAFGRIPPGVDLPRPRLERRALVRALIPAARGMLRTVRREKPQVTAFLEGNPEHCAALVARIADLDAPGLAALWDAELRPLLERASDMLQVAGRSDPQALLGARWIVEKLAGPADAAALTTGADLASMGPVVGAVQVARGELTAEEYRRRWGHRGPDEFEVGTPPGSGAASTVDGAAAAGALLDARRAARDAAWARLPARRAPIVRRAVRSWNAAAEGRERSRSEVVRVFAVLRAWTARADAILEPPVAFLELDELLSGLRGAAELGERAAARRVVHARYAALPPYPSFVRGSFDPFAWAADPDRRADVWVEGAQPPVRSGAITGFAGAAGVVEGVARVLTSVDEGAALHPGEILVTTVTNVGWTPLFPRVAAVVTDVGAPLSHAAIVARELGIPAVVGCGDATTRLHTGDRVRVDGGAGTVTLLPT